MDLEDRIYKLVEMGKTYSWIIDFFERKGILITYEYITEICIIKLREQGMRYVQIAKFLQERGEKLTTQTIRNKYVNFYNGNEKSRSKNYGVDISEEHVYKLKEEGMLYIEIVEYFQKEGIMISTKLIQEICRKMYEEKEREKAESSKRRKNIKEKKLYELREQGMTYKEIEEYLESHGTKVSVTLIRDICKKMYEKNGKEDHRATHKRKEKNNMEKNESSEDLNKKLREKLKIKLEMENNPKAVTEKDSCKSERVENGIER